MEAEIDWEVVQAAVDNIDNKLNAVDVYDPTALLDEIRRSE